MRTCSSCKEMKPLSEFSRDARKASGYRSHCKTCCAERARKHRAKLGDEYREYKRKRYAANAEKERARCLAYKHANRDTERARMKRYMRDNRAYFTAYEIARQNKKRSATPKWADKKSLQGYYETADGLSMLTGEWWHVDHIVPLRSELVCGLHTPHNLRVIPASENLAKGNRHWPDMP